jgi:hypothetical protein
MRYCTWHSHGTAVTSPHLEGLVLQRPLGRRLHRGFQPLHQLQQAASLPNFHSGRRRLLDGPGEVGGAHAVPGDVGEGGWGQ